MRGGKYTVVEKGVFREHGLKWGFSDVQIQDTGVQGNTSPVPFCGARQLAHGIYGALLGSAFASLHSDACADAPMPFGATGRYIIPRNIGNYK